MLVALTVGLFVYLHKRNEMSLSKEDLVKYESVYHEYPVQYLRRVLDGYVTTNFDGLCVMPPAITASETKENDINAKSGLNSFDEAYYKSKFIVWTYNKNKSGNGNDIMILFRDKPDRLFYAWVGRDSEGEICLLGFNSVDNNPKVLKDTIKSLNPSIYDTKYGI